MIFTANNAKSPVLLKYLKPGSYFKSSLVVGVFCRLSTNIDDSCNVFCLSTGEVEDWDVDQTVTPVEITEVKFNYV